jgi:hypothetical protein
MQTSSRRAPWLLLLLAAALLLQFAWRTYLAAQFALAPSIPDRALTLLNWRLLDQFLGPTALILLAFSEYLHARNPSRPFWIVMGILLAAALTAVALAIASIPGAEAALEVTAAILLGLCVLVLGPRSLFALSRDIANRGGFTIDLLWRLLTLQWLLVWVAAEFILRINLRYAGGVSASERARNLLFALPAYALLPNILLSAGLYWLNPARSPQVRIRSWLTSMFTLNAAIVMLLLGEFANRWWTIGAVPLVLLALLLYPLGFPKGTWRVPANRLVLLAFATFVLGLILAAVEHARPLDQPALLREYDAAWRFLVGPAVLVLFLLAPALQWINTAVNAKYRTPVATRTALFLILAGVFLTPAAFLASLLNRNAVSFTALSTTLLWIGMLLAAAVALRAWRSPR